MTKTSVPQTFYKYVTAETAQKILESSKLRWSSPVLFNDLLEFQRMPVFKPSLKEANALFANAIYEIAHRNQIDLILKMKDPQQPLVKFIQESINKGMSRADIIPFLQPARKYNDANFECYMRKELMQWNPKYAKVLCVTTAYNNNAMWANYAGNHSGCVLGFRHVAELDTPLQEAKPVIYSDEPLVIGSGLDFLLYNDPPQFLENTLDGICRSKEKSWSYENEWRVFTWRKQETDLYYKDYFSTRKNSNLSLMARRCFLQ